MVRFLSVYVVARSPSPDDTIQFLQHGILYLVPSRRTQRMPYSFPPRNQYVPIVDVAVVSPELLVTVE